MGSMTTHFKNRIVNDVLRDGTQRYLALFDGSGVEATGGSYARKAITFTAGNPTANTATITFTSMPAGTWEQFGVFDAVSAGNQDLHDDLAAPVTTGAGDSITFDVGEVTFTAS